MTDNWPRTEVRPPAPHEMSMPDADDRYQELHNREIMAAGIADGKVDPAALGRDYPPLTKAELLEKIALGEVLARYYRSAGNVQRAVAAGATWQEIAAAMGATEADTEYTWQHNGWIAANQATTDRAKAAKSARTCRSANPEAQRVAIVRRLVTPWVTDQEM